LTIYELAGQRPEPSFGTLHQHAHTDLADDLAAYEANLGRAAGSETSAPAEPPAPKKQRRNPKA
jgi:hypothetical protein